VTLRLAPILVVHPHFDDPAFYVDTRHNSSASSPGEVSLKFGRQAQGGFISPEGAGA
jgi:hypothetical protein